MRFFVKIKYLVMVILIVIIEIRSWFLSFFKWLKMVIFLLLGSFFFGGQSYFDKLFFLDIGFLFIFFNFFVCCFLDCIVVFVKMNLEYEFLIQKDKCVMLNKNFCVLVGDLQKIRLVCIII